MRCGTVRREIERPARVRASEADPVRTDPVGLGFDVAAADARELERRRAKLAAYRAAAASTNTTPDGVLP